MIKKLLNSINGKIDKALKFSNQSFVSSTLKDSQTEVEYSTEVGGDAVVASGNGSEPLGDGEHELSDGVKITVQNGKVTNIEKPKEAEAEQELANEDEDSKEEKSEEKVDEAIDEVKEEEKDVEISLEEEPTEESVASEDEIEEAVEVLTGGDKAEIQALKAEVEALKKVLDERFNTVPSQTELQAFKAQLVADITATLRNTPAQSFTAVVTEKEEDRFLAMARASKRNKN